MGFPGALGSRLPWTSCCSEPAGICPGELAALLQTRVLVGCFVPETCERGAIVLCQGSSPGSLWRVAPGGAEKRLPGPDGRSMDPRSGLVARIAVTKRCEQLLDTCHEKLPPVIPASSTDAEEMPQCCRGVATGGDLRPNFGPHWPSWATCSAIVGHLRNSPGPLKVTFREVSLAIVCLPRGHLGVSAIFGLSMDAVVTTKLVDPSSFF